MKIKIRAHDASMPQENDWLQTDGWLAELRDDGGADPAGDGHAQPARGSDPWPEVLAEAAALARAEAAAPPPAPRLLSGPRPPAPRHAAARTEAEAAARTRGRCPRRDDRAGGDRRSAADAGHVVRDGFVHLAGTPIPPRSARPNTRARAMAPWLAHRRPRRLARPRCRADRPGFWPTRPVVPWDWYTALARAARAAVRSDGDPPAGPPEPDGTERASSVPAAVVLKAVRGWACFACRTEIDRALMASQPAGSTGCDWRLRAAEMAGLVNGSWRSPPGRTRRHGPGLPAADRHARAQR